ncbi:MAG: DUF4924 family protein [Bacteroidales bacterium]|nr:DUF4924 family protein [Bacteroidales bacterium]MBD5212903.1 DUF4924 family protein [Bacteroidales bacterium]MBD5221272.1 DUF4924 family protein [Bacteroidales bacterium]
MYTASEKKKQNIAEYLIYMWQIEDLIRAHGLDIDKIQENIIDKYSGLTDAQLKDMRDWYESLIDMMRREDVDKSGHLQINKNVIIQLDDLNAQLIRDPRYADYAAQYYKTLPYIVEIRSKAGENKAGEIESCFNALYGILLLRLQGKEISKETLEAANQISRFLALLAKYYVKDQNNELFQDNE